MICPCGKIAKSKGFCLSCYQKEYYRTHPEQYEKHKRKQRQWIKDHPEKVKENTLRFLEKNPGYAARKTKEWRERKREKVRVDTKVQK